MIDLNETILKNLGVTPTDLPIFDVPIDLLIPRHDNANEMDDSTFNRLVEEISEVGFLVPLQIAPALGNKFSIIGGRQRWDAARTLGYEKVPCVMVELEEDLQLLVSVRLNVIHGNLNPDKFRKLYDQAVKKYGKEQLKELFGFTDSDAWNKLIGDVASSLKESGIPAETVQKIAKKARKVRSVDGLGKILRKFFEHHGDDLKYVI